MILHRVPVDHQQVAFGRIDSLLNLIATKTLGFGDDGFHAPLDRLVERTLCARLDAEVRNFENHVPPLVR